MLLPEALEDISKVINYDVKAFLQKLVNFQTFQAQVIYDYYAGTLQVQDVNSFNTLDQLIQQCGDINRLMILNTYRLNNLKYWEFVEFNDDAKLQLLLLRKAYKFLRSSKVTYGFSSQPEHDYTLTQFEHLENVADKGSYSDPQNDWVQIALRNDLREEDYDVLKGGTTIKLPNAPLNDSLEISSVIGYLQGIEVYGRDIDKKITYLDNDLKILSPSQTVRQAIVILTNLKQGDNPQYPSHGIQSSVVVGTNLRALNFPVLMRQLYNTFTGDDTLTQFKVDDVRFTNDNQLIVQFEVNTRLGEIIGSQIQT